LGLLGLLVAELLVRMGMGSGVGWRVERVQ